MKKVLVVFTGGTIGSSVNEHIINPSAENQYRLFALYKERFTRANQVEFLHIAPIEMLSENLVPIQWERIISAIDAVDKDDLAGIIVTHGTDTLAYSACALSFYYTHLPIPLILVSSDYPLTDARANGLDNFNAAVAFIIDRVETGVFVAYRNSGQPVQFHVGTQLLSCLPLSNDFMSVQAKAYLQFADDHFTELHAPPPSFINQAQYWRLKPQFSTRVLMIRPYPGLNYDAFNLKGIDAILHDCYHSGTACITDEWGECYGLLGFIQRCKQQGVAVYLAPVPFTVDRYSTTKALADAGAELLCNQSLEAAYVKLLLAYGNFDDRQARLAFLKQNSASENLDFSYS